MEQLHTLYIEGLGVVIAHTTPDGPVWWTEALNYDYGAQGETPEKALKHFISGIEGTYKLNMEHFGHIKGMLR